MKVGIVGGTGLIGSAVLARLASLGHAVVSMSRSAMGVSANHVAVDISKATSPAYWLPYLEGVEAVVNCAGVLQDAPKYSTAMVHHHGIANLFAACEQLKIRRVIHFSAIGVDRETPSAFSETKLSGDKALMERNLDWIILRPSVVIGRPAYGASALMRGLAALPAIPVMPNTGPLQIVLLEDVVRTVEHFLDPGAPTRKIVELVGPHRYSFLDVVALIRRWYRWPPSGARGPFAEIRFKRHVQIRRHDFPSWLAASCTKQCRAGDRARRDWQSRRFPAAWASSKRPSRVLRLRTSFCAGALVCAHVFA